MGVRMKRCKECGETLITYYYFDSENKRHKLLIHPRTIDNKCSFSTDGIEINVVNQALQNRIKNNAVKEPETLVSGEEIAKIETKEIASQSNEDLIKRKLCTQEISIEDFDRIKKRLE